MNSFESFSDELVKIAFLNRMARGFTDALKTGWHGIPGTPSQASWMGQHGVWKHLPVGTKSLAVAGTVPLAAQALAKKDPLGSDKSRAERVTGLIGGTAGSLAASGALMRTAWGSRHPILAGIAGSLTGGVAGERIMTSPWTLGRKLRSGAAPQQQIPQPQPEAVNG